MLDLEASGRSCAVSEYTYLTYLFLLTKLSRRVSFIGDAVLTRASISLENCISKEAVRYICLLRFSSRRCQSFIRTPHGRVQLRGACRKKDKRRQSGRPEQ